jgi:aryl sulfotransferase
MLDRRREGQIMTIEDIAIPAKTREARGRIFNSATWNDFVFRDGDIIIGTYAKSGTTWMQQIVGQLIFNGAEGVPVSEMSPWLDFILPSTEEKFALLEAQTHRRFIKTHLPLDALRVSPQARYIYIGRDGRDVAWSMHNHHSNFVQAAYDALNASPDRGPGPPLSPPTPDVHQYYREWIAGDGYPWWPFWENIRSWWAARHAPNILLTHFARLKADMAGEIRRIADFLEIPVDPATWPAIIEHCSFDYMKANASQSAPMGGMLWEGGGTTFINRGVNDRWRDVLTAEECADYDVRARAELGEACARWLATGERND